MLQSELIVLGTVAVMTAYWWYVLVPGARVNLAINKKNGRLRTYLEELKNDDSRPLERWSTRALARRSGARVARVLPPPRSRTSRVDGYIQP